MKTIAKIIHHKSFPLKILSSNKNLIYYENSDRWWDKYEFDSKGNIIYYENLHGIIEDNRP